MLLQTKTYISMVFFLSPWICAGQHNDYKEVEDLFVESNNLYYLISQKEIPLNDSILFGYSGFNDSLSIYIDGKLVYSGVPKWEPIIGYGDEILRLKRKGSYSPYKICIDFHGKKTKVEVLFPNIYNSMLIHNLQNYSEGMEEYDEMVDIFFYMESNRFIDY